MAHPWLTVIDHGNYDANRKQEIVDARAVNRRINHYCALSLATAAILAVGTLISGCNRDAHTPAAKATTAPAVIRLLVVDEPSLVAAIQGIAGDWKAQSDSPLQVSAISAEEAATAEQLDADAVIFPPSSWVLSRSAA